MTKEERADREVESGMFRDFDSMEPLIANLHSPDHISCPSCGCIFYPEVATIIHCGAND